MGASRIGRLHSLLAPQSPWPSGEYLRLRKRHSLAACCSAMRWSPRSTSCYRRACLGTQGRGPFLPLPSRESPWTLPPYKAFGPTPAGECDLGTCFRLAGLALLSLAPSVSDLVGKSRRPQKHSLLTPGLGASSFLLFLCRSLSCDRPFLMTRPSARCFER